MWTAGAAAFGAAAALAAVALRSKARLSRSHAARRSRAPAAAAEPGRGGQSRGERDLAAADEGVLRFRAIATVHSCFPDRRGTPRQGMLVPAARAEVVLAPHVPAAALDGLEGYSLVWLVFVFHKNRLRKDGSASSKAHIRPPKGGGRSVGVFATRSPHRPNPVGLSLVRVLRVDGRRILVGGADLVDGTPVLDIKPYVPVHDARPDAGMPQWVEVAQEQARLPVVWSDEARAALAAAAGSLR